jgi:hypothetical protein
MHSFYPESPGPPLGLFYFAQNYNSGLLRQSWSSSDHWPLRRLFDALFRVSMGQISVDCSPDRGATRRECAQATVRLTRNDLVQTSSSVTMRLEIARCAARIAVPLQIALERSGSVEFELDVVLKRPQAIW